MKRLSYFVLIVIALACGSKSLDASSSEESLLEKPIKVTKEVNTCTAMAFFQKGAEILAKTYNKAGVEVSSQLTKVLEVSEQDGFTVAKVEGVNTDLMSKKETNVTFSYKCNGKSVFFDIASMYRTEAKNKDSSFQSGEFEFPLEVKVGETLPDISSSMESEQGGMKMSMTFTISNRQVEAEESITTEAGTWKCFKISNEINVAMDVPGMDAKMKEMMASMQSENIMTATTWFTPELGVLKTEVYRNGELESTNRIISISK
ncbi:hypothetical protein [uncultured Algoriphagus sp.]|uniref:TapB family protein n=1 Tax=uncultured Algoriphagus sp. TaxID=417365 RepID=UPI0030EF73FD|tara:strand:+ start:16445 stop:17227 length:783 start_codon:yes stop_codon:yes gene_type:complete